VHGVRLRDGVFLDQQRDVVVVFWGRSVYTVRGGGGAGYVSNSGTVASKRQNTASSKFNDDISLLISQYLISGTASWNMHILYSIRIMCPLS
jgi:hypothetical protein